MAVTGHWHLEKRICRGEKGAGKGTPMMKLQKPEKMFRKYRCEVQLKAAI